MSSWGEKTGGVSFSQIQSPHKDNSVSRPNAFNRNSVYIEIFKGKKETKSGEVDWKEIT